MSRKFAHCSVIVAVVAIYCLTPKALVAQTVLGTISGKENDIPVQVEMTWKQQQGP